MSDEKNYQFKVTLNLEGFPGYIVDQLLQIGLHGRSRTEIAERALMKGLEDLANSNGITLEDAKGEGYDVSDPPEDPDED